LRRIGVVAIVIGAVAIAAALLGKSAGSPTLATVDGVAISRDAYDEYAGVFTAPDGSLRVSKEDVLLSLVNQVLVLKEADRRGLAVSDQDVSGAVADMDEDETVELGLPGGGDDPGFRERVRRFLLFGLVKSAVVGTIEVPVDVLEAAYRADPSLHVLEFSEAAPVLRKRIVSRESDRRWAEWLGRQRACADIRVLDSSFDLPSSSPGTDCASATAR